MNNRKTKKVFSILLTLIMIISMMSTVSSPAKAAAGTIYESEGNNTYLTAEITYDDYNNYGTISSASDVDWWKMTFSTGGMVNIWMGRIPSGCDYDLSVYREDSEGMFYNYECATSVRRTGNQEFMKIKVYAGETLLVKVKSVAGYSSSKYLLRFKLYDEGGMKFYYYFENGDTDATEEVRSIVDLFEMCDYSANYYLRQNATTIYNGLPNTGVVFLLGHANKGIMVAGSGTYLVAGDYNVQNSVSINNYGSTALSNNNLIVFGGCNTGLNHQTAGNLVNRALSKGAHCCIGWKGEVLQRQLNDWLTTFSLYLSSGYNVAEAMTETDLMMRDSVDDNDPDELIIFERETGTSESNSYILG